MTTTIEQKWHAVTGIPGLAEMSPEEAARKAFAIGVLYASEDWMDLPIGSDLIAHYSAQRSKAWKFFAEAFGIEHPDSNESKEAING